MIGKEGMAEYLTADNIFCHSLFPDHFSVPTWSDTLILWKSKQTFSQQFKHAKLHSDLLQAQRGTKPKNHQSPYRKWKLVFTYFLSEEGTNMAVPIGAPIWSKKVNVSGINIYRTNSIMQMKIFPSFSVFWGYFPFVVQFSFKRNLKMTKKVCVPLKWPSSVKSIVEKYLLSNKFPHKQYSSHCFIALYT